MRMHAYGRRLAPPLALLLGGCGSSASPSADGPTGDGADATVPETGADAAVGADVTKDGAADPSSAETVVDVPADMMMGVPDAPGGSRDGGGCLATQPPSTLYEYWCRTGSTELCFTDRLIPF